MPFGSGRRTKGEVFRHSNLSSFKKEQIWIKVEAYDVPVDIEVPLNKDGYPIMKQLRILERRKVLRRGQHIKYIIVKIEDGRLVQRELIQ